MVSKNGIDGDGVITIVLGAGLIGIGVAIGVKQGLLWSPIVAFGLALAAGFVTDYDMYEVRRRGHGLGISIGSGLWLVMIGAVGAVVLEIAGMIVRDRY